MAASISLFGGDLSAAAEAIVIGGGLGGLSAAIHLRLQGRAVTLFEANAQVGGRASQIEAQGYRFDTGPSLLNYPWVFEALFTAAGRRLSDYVELLPVDPSVQFRWPDGTIFSLSSNVKHLLAECERIEPGCGPRLFDFLRDAARKYRIAFDRLVTKNEDQPVRWLRRLSWRELFATGVWRSLDRELSRFFRSRYIREAFGSYGMYLGGSPFELPGLFTILAYGELAYGLWLPRGGIYALVEAMLRLATELGVVVRTGCRVIQVEELNGSVTGVRLETNAFVPARVVVSNLDLPSTERNLLSKRISPPVKMTPGVLTFYWGVRGQVENCGHHTIFLPSRFRSAFEELKAGKLPGELPFYVSVPSATDRELAPEGCSAVFVLVPTPTLQQMGPVNWADVTEQVRDQVLAKLGLDHEKIDFEEVWTPEEWSQRFGLHDGSAFGAAHILFQMGPWRGRNYSRQTRGLYFAGASTTPGTGMPMVILSGQMVAERIASHAC